MHRPVAGTCAVSAFRQGADTYHPLRKLKIAWAGIRHAVLLDFSVAYKLAVATVFLVLAAATESALHFLVLLVVTALMLVAEVMNTVIEALCDYLCPDYDERIRDIKDMAAAAAFIAVAVWYVVIGGIGYEFVSAQQLF
ncbi:MAG: diacylglycerol kinase [Gammaproteobacteria bacterium]|nr:diacylglycerol kinase [Gammaproteobacteria bacterium]MBK80008.1 diacylglycerol kinase [Gammaproteobacteria bacterium]